MDLPRLDHEEKHLGHAAGIDDEDEWCPYQHLRWVELGRDVRLDIENNRKKSGDYAPDLDGFPTHYSDDDHGKVNNDDDYRVEPGEQRPTIVWSQVGSSRDTVDGICLHVSPGEVRACDGRVGEVADVHVEDPAEGQQASVGRAGRARGPENRKQSSIQRWS